MGYAVWLIPRRRAYADQRIARWPARGKVSCIDLAGEAEMKPQVAAVTLALALPAFLWPPKPARAATVDTSAGVVASSAAASSVARCSRGEGSAR